MSLHSLVDTAKEEWAQAVNTQKIATTQAKKDGQVKATQALQVLNVAEAEVNKAKARANAQVVLNHNRKRKLVGYTSDPKPPPGKAQDSKASAPDKAP